MELIDAVGEMLPLPDDSVDCVLFAYVLCSVDSVEEVLSETRRVLHPNGTVCVLEHVRAEPGRGPSGCSAWCRSAGSGRA